MQLLNCLIGIGFMTATLLSKGILVACLFANFCSFIGLISSCYFILSQSSVNVPLSTYMSLFFTNCWLYLPGHLVPCVASLFVLLLLTVRFCFTQSPGSIFSTETESIKSPIIPANDCVWLNIIQ